MFRLLNLSPFTFTMAAARKNYRYIMSAVHPDKCNSVHADAVSKLVTHAFHTLSIPRKRVYYLNHGTPSYQESYDNDEAEEIVKYMRFILDKFERDREDELSFERSKRKRTFDQIFAQSFNPSNKCTDEMFKESTEEPIKRCKRASEGSSCMVKVFFSVQFSNMFLIFAPTHLQAVTNTYTMSQYSIPPFTFPHVNFKSCWHVFSEAVRFLVMIIQFP